MSFNIQLIEQTFNDEEFADSEVHVGNKCFKVNRYFLCLHSDVFKAYFRNDSIEKKTGKIEIKDLDANLVECMLKFMYGIKIENIKEIAHDLFVVAERYNVQKLMKLCLDTMTANVDNSSLHKCLELSFQMNLPKLQQKSIKFVAKELENKETRKERLDELKDLFKQNEEIACELINHILNNQKNSSPKNNENDEEVFKFPKDLRTAVQRIQRDPEMRQFLNSLFAQIVNNIGEERNAPGNNSQGVVNNGSDDGMIAIGDDDDDEAVPFQFIDLGEFSDDDEDEDDEMILDDLLDTDEDDISVSSDDSDSSISSDSSEDELEVLRNNEYVPPAEVFQPHLPQIQLEEEAAIVPPNNRGGRGRGRGNRRAVVANNREARNHLGGMAPLRAERGRGRGRGNGGAVARRRRNQEGNVEDDDYVPPNRRPRNN